MGSPAKAGGLPGGATALLVFTLMITTSLGDGNVGCLFSPDLCAEEYEWCFDDYAFGRCLPLYGHVDEDYLYRRELGPAELQALEGQMTRLFAEGFRWSHAYTQCVMQASLRAVQLGEELEEEPATECEPLAERQSSSSAVVEVQNEEPDLEPNDMAFVRFTPSAGNPHAEFADELYFPPLERQPARGVGPAFAAELRALEQPMVLESGGNNPVKKAEQPQQQQPRFFHTLFNTPDSFRRGEETRDQHVVASPAAAPQETPPQPAYTEGGLVFVQAPPGGTNNDEVEATAAEEEEARLEAILAQYGGLDWGFKRRERLDVKKPGPPFLTNSYAYRESSDSPLKSHQERALSEPDKGHNDVNSGQRSPTPSNRDEPAQQQPSTGGTKETEPEHDSNELPEVLNEPRPSPPRRRPPPPPQSHSAPDDEDHLTPFEMVDPSFAYVGFKHSVRSWKQGADVVNLLADLLHLDRSDLSNVRVDLNEVTFKVEEPNAQGLNASEVARQVDSLKGKLKEVLGVEVTAAGIGDKTKLPSMVAVGAAGDSERRMLVLTLLACGVLSAAAVSAGVILLVRRHSRSRDKLQALSQPDNEASKDYQELCRARMAAKAQQQQQNEKGSGEGAVQRVRDAEANNSPSSRSSTSSWSEEPALSNMDISTGHMVLSYMEDHLHNKGRLEQEWVALCAYEAEPCATTISYQPENAPKNRYPDVVPYDHSRVVLNALANAAGSDYINASSITDHDPRNPAYIATQGPLATTAADFWQMVWEQGSVVMVMLTRLTEGGTTMCHRYWPEEGSELYHVYEVHLVSEHIWCDDYLVRSFYLKNVKTGETRTVTQFHFLSWPEGGVPTSTKALLEFRRKVNKSYRGRSCPIVVHCSDGAGRTGTYCLMDMVLNRMSKGAKEIDIAATLEHIRDQRGGMVRTKAQFELVLMAVAEEVHAILKALPQ